MAVALHLDQEHAEQVAQPALGDAPAGDAGSSSVTTISTVNSRASASTFSLGERRAGSRIGVSTTITTRLTNANGRPTFADLEEPEPGSPVSLSRPVTTRLVEVPIRVTVPPTTAAKLTGIRYLDGERPARRAQLMTGGMAMATIGVLFRKAEAVAVGTRTRARVARSLDAGRGRTTRGEARHGVLEHPGPAGGRRHHVEGGDGERSGVREAREGLLAVDHPGDEQEDDARRGR